MAEIFEKVTFYPYYFRITRLSVRKTEQTCPKQVKNTSHAVPRFRGAHVSQSGASRGIPSGFNVTTPTWTNDREVKSDLGVDQDQ